MKRLIVAAVTIFSMFAVPAAATHAGGPPPPCEPEGNYCVVQHSGSWTDTVNHVTISATWLTDANTGDIVSMTPSLSPTDSCGPYWSPSNPNEVPYTGPIEVYYEEYPGTNDIITLTANAGGTSSGNVQGSGLPPCGP